MPLRASLRTLLIAWLIVAVETPDAAERVPERYQEFLDNGDRALRDGRCTSAEDWYLYAIREAEAIDPKGPLLVRSLVRLAEVYRSQGPTGRSPGGAIQRRLKLLSTASPEAAAAVARWESDEASRLASRPAAADKAAENAYLEKVRERIRPKWVYPREAGDRGIEGEGIADLTIRRDGHLQAARITRSTGVPILDKAMLDAIDQAQPFPVVPDAIRQDPYQIDLSFRYQIAVGTSSSPRPLTTPPPPVTICR